MLLLGSRLISTPILSLQTGTRLAVTKSPVIDPSNLKIIAYEVDGAMLTEKPSYILISDIRELSDIGMIIDSSDDFINKNDVVSVKKILDLNFNLIGLSVIDDHKRKIGKVADYSLDTESFIIQQLNVSPGILKSISKTESLIHRSQIVEINDYSVIVRSTHKKIEDSPKVEKLSYINPFRSTNAV